MLTIQQKLNLERAVRASTAMSTANPLITQTDAELLDEWETVGGKLQPKSDANNLRIGTASEVLTNEYADFENKGTNLAWSGVYFSNSLDYSSDFCAGLASGNYTTTQNVGSSPATSEDFFGTDPLAPTHYGRYLWNGAIFEVDLGSLQTFNVIITKVYTNWSLTSSIMYGKVNIGDGWTLLHSAISFNESGIIKHPLTGDVQYRYLKFAGGTFRNNVLTAPCIGVHMQSYLSSDNTVEADVQFTGAKSFAPSSIVIDDDAGSPITASGKMNIDYDKNGAGFTGSLIDLVNFKALSSSLFNGCTSLALQYQPVGAQKFQPTTEISTQSSEITLGTDGSLDVSVAGSTKFSIDGDGNTITDGYMSGDGFTSDTISIDDTDSVYAIDGDYENIFVDTTSGTVEITLPASTSGKKFKFKKTAGANTITISSPSGEQVESSASIVLSASNESIELISDGSNWWKTAD